VLYVYTSCEIIGPKVDWSAWGAKEDEEVEAEGLDRNLRWSSPRNVKGILLPAESSAITRYVNPPSEM